MKGISSGVYFSGQRTSVKEISVAPSHAQLSALIAAV